MINEVSEDARDLDAVTADIVSHVISPLCFDAAGRKPRPARYATVASAAQSGGVAIFLAQLWKRNDINTH